MKEMSWYIHYLQKWLLNSEENEDLRGKEITKIEREVYYSNKSNRWKEKGIFQKMVKLTIFRKRLGWCDMKASKF